MNKLATALIVIIVVATLIPCFPVRAEQGFIPHEDPSAAQSTMDAYAFFSQYIEVLSLIASKQYANASILAEQLSHITVPADLAYIINRYNNLTQQINEILSDLQATLDTTVSLLNQYRLDEASLNLDHAGVLVAKAQILLEDLQDATTTLSQRLGVFAATVEGKTRQAYDELQKIIQRLNELIKQYHELLQRLKRQVEEIRTRNLVPTSVTLRLNTTTCFVGDFIAVSGKLTSNGVGMQNRTVALLLDGITAGKAVTRIDGSYYATIQVPFKYVHQMTMQALYAPTGNDLGVYLASVSPTVQLNVTFYNTALTVTVPSTAYPGLQFTVSGSVSSQGTFLSGRTVKTYFDGVLLNEAQTDTAGFFEVQKTVGAEVKTGVHNITFTVSSEGIYAGTRLQKTINVVKVASTVEVNAPTFVLLPAQLQINGNVGSTSGPLENAKVTLEFAGESTAIWTSNEGIFNATITIPLSSVFAGFQNLKVTVDPSEPWRAATQTTSEILVLNSVSIGLVSIVSVSIGGIGYLRLARTKKKKDEKEPQTLGATTQVSTIVATPSTQSKPQFKLEGLKGKVLESYVRALKVVEPTTGIILRSNMTLREFLIDTKPKLSEAASLFAELTALAERALYSPYTPKEEDLAQAEDHAINIGRVLKGEAK